MKKRYFRITLFGCHDMTTIKMALTPEEVELMEKLEKAFKETSKSECEPVLRFTEI